ncbi:hypothetical protein VPH35_046529 [Triticum aestivum]
MLNYLSVKIYISFGGISEEQSYHKDAHAEQARLSKPQLSLHLLCFLKGLGMTLIKWMCKLKPTRLRCD